MPKNNEIDARTFTTFYVGMMVGWILIVFSAIALFTVLAMRWVQDAPALPYVFAGLIVIGLIVVWRMFVFAKKNDPAAASS